jgi:VanZ family protein
VLLWAGAIFLVSAQPRVPLPHVSGADKVAHALAYAGMGFLLARAARASGLSPVWAVVIGILYGLSDEIHQSFVPGRTPDLADLAADAVGVIVGTLVHQRWLARRREPSRPAAPGRSSLP